MLYVYVCVLTGSNLFFGLSYTSSCHSGCLPVVLLHVELPMLPTASICCRLLLTEKPCLDWLEMSLLPLHLALLILFFALASALLTCLCGVSMASKIRISSSCRKLCVQVFERVHYVHTHTLPVLVACSRLKLWLVTKQHFQGQATRT